MTRICALEGCNIEFTPKAAHGLYCSRPHKRKAAKIRAKEAAWAKGTRKPASLIRDTEDNDSYTGIFEPGEIDDLRARAARGCICEPAIPGNGSEPRRCILCGRPAGPTGFVITPLAAMNGNRYHRDRRIVFAVELEARKR